MSELCMCGSVDVRIRSEKDADGFGDFIWAECRGCGLRSQNKFVSERCPQSNQECLDDFNEIIKPFKSAQQRINELEVQLKEREWISVEDNLPPIDVWVLWFDGDRTMNPNNTQYHIDKINERGECLMNYLHNYTHWMPLPQPPKEKGRE